MSVVTLEGREFPSVLNVRVDGKLRSYVPERSDELHPADRDRLLALADDMEKMAGAGYMLSGGGLEMCVKNIREALGVSDGS